MLPGPATGYHPEIKLKGRCGAPVPVEEPAAASLACCGLNGRLAPRLRPVFAPDARRFASFTGPRAPRRSLLCQATLKGARAAGKARPTASWTGCVATDCTS